MSKRQDQRSKNDLPYSARPSADTTGWSPLFRALRREFRDNLARVAAGNDPVTRLLGYRNLLRSRYGVDLPAAEEDSGRPVHGGAGESGEGGEGTGDAR